MARERTLKATGLVFRFTCKGNLWYLIAQHRSNGFVGNIAHLVVVDDDFTTGITHTAIVAFHEGIASAIVGANIAVDTCPAIFTVARLPFAHRSVESIGQGATH